jgi:DNA mismatch endonuclease (patch repair protein)
MADVFSRKKRSWIMAQIKSCDTKPERAMRRILRRMHVRFRTHVAVLPGKPDFVLVSRRRVIFIHGCFWHGHARCRKAAIPETHRDFWINKINGNRQRDKKAVAALRKNGWKVLILWTCQMTPKKQLRLLARLDKFFKASDARKKRGKAKKLSKLARR